MSNRTIHSILIAVVILLLSFTIAEAVLVKNTLSNRQTTPPTTDTAQLEQAVNAWKDKKPFSFKGQKASTSPAQKKKTTYTIYIYNATGEKGVAETIEKQLKAVDELLVKGVEETRTEKATTIMYKKEVPEGIISAITALLEDSFGKIKAETASAEKAEKLEGDIVLILGA